MRTISTAQDKALAGDFTSTFTKVEIEDGDGVLVDVNSGNLFGWSWLRSVDISDDIDSQMQTAKLILTKQIIIATMAPLMTGSRFQTDAASGKPFLDLNRQVKISVATLGMGSGVVPGDFVLIFDGNIDTLDWSGETVSISCTDKGRELLRAKIEQDSPYGAALGRPIELVIADILFEWLPSVTLFSENGTGGTPFNPGDSPGFNLIVWTVRPTTVMSALEQLVDQIGWSIRYRFQVNTAEFQLVLYEPDRTASTPDRTFSKTQYSELSRVGIDIKTIINAIQITYTEAPTSTDPAVKKVRTLTDATSIAKFGRRWMTITEAGTSQINTEAEADDFINALLDDLKEPKTIAAANFVKLFWPVQLQDLYRFTANNEDFDTDQDLAVVSVAHSIRGGQARTTLGLRGQPASKVDRWQEFAGLPGVAKSPRNFAPDDPIASVVQAVGGLRITLPYPTRDIGGFSHYEIHVSDVPVFTPSAATLVGSGPPGQQSVQALPAGEERFIQVVAVDKENNRVAVPADEQTKTVGFAGPGLLNPDTLWPLGGFIWGGFDVFSRGLDGVVTEFPPDGWDMETGDWDTDAKSN